MNKNLKIGLCIAGGIIAISAFVFFLPAFKGRKWVKGQGWTNVGGGEGTGGSKGKIIDYETWLKGNNATDNAANKALYQNYVKTNS